MSMGDRRQSYEPMNSAGTPNHSNHDDATYNTALRGAFLAFQKTATNRTITGPSTPASGRDTGNGNGNGALMAATSASRDHSVAYSPPISRQTSGGNRAPDRNRRSFPQHQPTMGRSNPLTPAKPATGYPRSPSLIAATIAASRSTSPKTAPSVQVNVHQSAQELYKGNAGEDSTISSGAEIDLTTDSSSIGPTNALVSLFERKEDETGLVKKRPALSSGKMEPRAGLRPMIPPRTMSPVVAYDTSPSILASSFTREKTALPSPSRGRHTARAKSPLQDAGRPSESKNQPPPTPPARIRVDAELPISISIPNSERTTQTVTLPQRAISQTNSLILSPQPIRTSSQKIVANLSDTSATSTPPLMQFIPQSQMHTSMKTMPLITSSAGEKSTGSLVRRSSSLSSNDTFVLASSAPSPQPDSQRKSPRRPTPPVNTVSLIPPSRPLALQSAPNLPLDSLTNAIVAGSLASARATPSIAKPPTPPPRKQMPHIRQTLRSPRAKSEQEVTGVRSQYKKKPLSKLSSRKKHSHHEGARKRWREEITTSERQRYEGVWASNRGLLLDSPNAVANGLRDIDTSQLVANVVVRDIWVRSRLPSDELAEVWDLVDTQGKGALDRPQFVVGMWLIDQRLRGRKIPRKVSDSVWGSAKGVRVPSPKQ
ncbi:hypothetical protein ANO14919_112840 [Xylariales sp. No.14919]|nr:hypothetical protein ANO14919_112840 [Xylariales sp. No.14919]